MVVAVYKLHQREVCVKLIQTLQWIRNKGMLEDFSMVVEEEYSVCCHFPDLVRPLS